MNNILKKILEDKYKWIDHRKKNQPESELIKQIHPQRTSFHNALIKPETGFILECKKASPSNGLLRPNFNLDEIINVYHQYANAISVLTDQAWFQGRFEDLKSVREKTNLPILCKDFIIDPYQIYLANHYGADAILLMLSILEDHDYQRLSKIAKQFKMDVLTEISTKTELKRARNLKAEIIGINNRNLKDLTIDLNKTKALAKHLPKEQIIVSESGYTSNQEIRQNAPFVHAFLIGTQLMKAKNLKLETKKLIYGSHKVCGLTRLEDVYLAEQANAVFGGFIFAKSSKRKITLKQADLLLQKTQLIPVGVFQNQPIKEVINIAHKLSLFALQLHGNEDQAYIQTLKKSLNKSCKIWKALTITEEIPKLNQYPNIDRFLLDSPKTQCKQISFNWSLLTPSICSKIMLAGGISKHNIKQALSFNCLGLDVNSGVEISTGIKSYQKLIELFKIIRAY